MNTLNGTYLHPLNGSIISKTEKDDSKYDRKITVHHAELLDDGDKGWTVDLDPNVPLPA